MISLFATFGTLSHLLGGVAGAIGIYGSIGEMYVRPTPDGESHLPEAIRYPGFQPAPSSCPEFQFLQTPPENDLFIQEKTFSQPQLKFSETNN